MRSITNPENGDFGDWKDVAGDYINEKFPDWHPQMVIDFQSDIAWRMEGITVSEKNMEEAFEDWISGNSPYSPHCVPKDGYDYEIWAKMRRRESQERAEKIAEEQFSDEPWNKNRFIDGFMGNLNSPFTTETEILNAVKKYRNGEVKYSPHWIPMTEEGMLNRQERIAFLKDETPEEDLFLADVIYSGASGYGTLDKLR